MGLNYERIMAYRPADIAVSYGERDCILYALGIGLGMDPLDPGQLKFVYERAGLEAFPTMAVVLGWPGRMTDPAFGIDERLVVHADLKVVLHRPLAPEGAARSAARASGGDRQGPRQRRHHPIDPRSRRRRWHAVATVESSAMARKHGGFGGKVTDAPAPAAVPADGAAAGLRSADAAKPRIDVSAQRRRESAACRSAARQGGGLRAPDPARRRELRHRCACDRCAPSLDYRAERLAGIEARFSRPVFPGETIRTEMWRDGARVPFQCRVVERGDIVLSQRARDLEDLTGMSDLHSLGQHHAVRRRRPGRPRLPPGGARLGRGTTCRRSCATGRPASIRPSSSPGTASSTSAAGSRRIGRRNTAAWARRSPSRSSCSRRSAGSARPRPIRTA